MLCRIWDGDCDCDCCCLGCEGGDLATAVGFGGSLLGVLEEGVVEGVEGLGVAGVRLGGIFEVLREGRW